MSAVSVAVGLFVSLAVIVALLTLRWLLRESWFLGWLKGNIFLLLLLLAAGLGAYGWDLSRYTSVKEGKILATIELQQTALQHYQLSVVDPDGEQQVYDVRGDQWDLYWRRLSWPSYLGSLSSLYAIDFFEGRFLSLEQQRHEQDLRTPVFPEALLDNWRWCQEQGACLFFDSNHVALRFNPSADGALFAVRATHGRLAIEPLNDAARLASALR